MGRVDDVINVAGHRLSTGEIEEVLGKHEKIAECAVVGRNDELKGQVPAGLVILKSGVTIESDDGKAQLTQELVQLIRDKIGAVASFKEVYIVPCLPKTRSGKILRKTIRHIFNGEEYVMPSTIEDPSTLETIKDTIVISTL